MGFLITLPGDPGFQSRPKATTVGGHIRMYDPSALAKNSVTWAMELQIPVDYEITPQDRYIVEITAFYKNKATNKNDYNLRTWRKEKLTKPDLDNIAKFYLDAGNGLLWHDDAQITDLVLKKRYCRFPRIEMKVINLRPNTHADREKIIRCFSKDNSDALESFLYRFGEAIQKFDGDPCDDNLREVTDYLKKYSEGLGKKIAKLQKELNA